MLQATEIQKSYGGSKILSNTNISVERGKITVLIGPSGSGKTTLLKILALLESADSGQLQVDNDVYKYPILDWKQVQPPWPRVTVVFQQLFLWPHLTLLQNMTLPLHVRGQKENQAQIDEMIALFAMEEFIHRYPNEASLGQRQRTALARALLLEPEYILLDEITSSLDVEQIAVILSYLKALKTKNIGILTITHLLHFAQDGADSIVFMDRGEVLEQGGREILDAPKHERLKKFLSTIEAAS